MRRTTPVRASAPAPRAAASRAAAAERQIFDTIADAIAGRRLPPGTKLTEEQLASTFGVSRARIRRVLLLLSQERIVTLKPNRGAYVARPTPQEAREVFAARRLIEDDMAARFAALPPAARAAAARRLTAHVERERAAAAAGDRSASIRLSGEFHQLVGTLAGNAVLAELLEPLIARSSLAIAAYQPPSAEDCAPDEHAAIIAALQDGDATLARRLMAEHLEEVEHKLVLDGAADPAIDLKRVLLGA